MVESNQRIRLAHVDPGDKNSGMLTAHLQLWHPAVIDLVRAQQGMLKRIPEGYAQTEYVA
jgi:hypothetical protein